MGDGETGTDEDWLTRFSVVEWLAAARAEHARSVAALAQKQHRAGVAQARRAAGMAWNAVLLGIPDRAQRARYGRSYMDHLKALSTDSSVPATVQEAASALISTPMQPELVQLGPGDTRMADFAALVLSEAQRRG